MSEMEVRGIFAHTICEIEHSRQPFGRRDAFFQDSSRTWVKPGRVLFLSTRSAYIICLLARMHAHSVFGIVWSFTHVAMFCSVLGVFGQSRAVSRICPGSAGIGTLMGWLALSDVMTEGDV